MSSVPCGKKIVPLTGTKKYSAPASSSRRPAEWGVFFAEAFEVFQVVFEPALGVQQQVSRPLSDGAQRQFVGEGDGQFGFVAEVVTLAKRGLRDGRTASRALGYRQVLAALDGDCTLEDARVATVQATRRFARKQMGWFNRDDRIEWLPYDAPDLVERCQTLIRRGAQLPA